MKVGVFLAGFTPRAGGGYRIQDDIYRALLEFAGESKHDFVIFCDGGFEVDASPQTSKVRWINYPQANLVERLIEKGSREFPAFRILWHRSSRLDRMANQAGVKCIWFLSPTPVYVDLPYLTIVWDLQHRLQPWFPEVSAHGIWDRREIYYSWLLKRAAVIIAGTETGRREIESLYQIPADHIHLLPHPTPQFALAAPLRDPQPALQRYGIPDGFLFYPAQFWAHKNHVNLLLAVRQLRDEYKIILPVVFVGSDPGNRGFVQKQVNELGLTAQVHFLGFISQEDLIDLYRSAFALTYVTLFGPENLPPLEAFALGCPVVASNVAGAQEQLGDAALLVDPRNPTQIALAIKSIYDDPKLRSTLIRRGCERASKWTARDFVRGAFSILDDFETVLRTWDS